MASTSHHRALASALDGRQDLLQRRCDVVVPVLGQAQPGAHHHHRVLQVGVGTEGGLRSTCAGLGGDAGLGQQGDSIVHRGAVEPVDPVQALPVRGSFQAMRSTMSRTSATRGRTTRWQAHRRSHRHPALWSA